MWILRALDLAKCIKDFGDRRLREEFSMWLNSSFKYFREQMRTGLRQKTYDDTCFGVVIVVIIKMYVVVFTGRFTVNLEF